MVNDIDEELLLVEVEERLEDLKYEFGDDVSSEIKVFQKLRDEFKDPKYKKSLEILGINSNNTGLVSKSFKNDNSNVWGKSDTKHLESLVQILLNPQAHISNTEKRIKGFYEDTPGNWKRMKGFIAPPPKEIGLIIQFLEGIFLPQNIVSKKNLTIRDFEDTMNRQLNLIRVRLENYPDHIVKPGVIKYICGILLNEVQVVKNAIESGRLGDLATDILTGTVTERNDPKPALTKEDMVEALKR